MHLSLVVKRWLNRTTRQSTFWKPKHYEAIPHYVKPHFIDIHDTYQLRTHEEVMNELRGREFEVEVERVIYKSTDIREEMKGRKAILLANMEQFQLTELQLERFKVLVGCRYDEKKNVLKLTCELFPDYLQNHTKIHEMFHDIVMETKRAP
jgi:hypothetical protein